MTDITALTIAYLTNALECEVFAEVPNKAPEVFVTVERTGGGAEMYGAIDHPTLAVQSWAKTQLDAYDLAAQVDGLMLAMPFDETNVFDCERNSLYNFPDPDSRQSRYQGVYELTTQ